MPRARGRVIAVRTSRICKMYEIAPSTLQYWVRLGLVGPSVVAGSGNRFERWWSTDDVVRVRTIKTLRESGCSLQKIRAATALLRRIGTNLAASHLIWDGTELFVVDGWGEVMATIRDPGQLAFQVLVIPVAEWAGAAAEIAEPVDLRAEAGRRRRSRQASTTARLNG
jgi:DNA-binding transcriptional MerR regulator